MKIIITVGTTKFNELIEEITKKSFLKILKKKGYNELTVQYGNSILDIKLLEKTCLFLGIKVSHYKRKENFISEIESSDTVLSHAGTGTVFSVLRSVNKYKRTPFLIVVVNESLLDNHQKEFAHEMERKDYLYLTKVEFLEECFKKKLYLKKYTPLPSPKKLLFS